MSTAIPAIEYSVISTSAVIGIKALRSAAIRNPDTDKERP